jgi:multidrug efflux pump subunit AcrA (membrane-fusion protein)
MSNPTSLEAARSRIQRLVDEIAALSKKDLRTEEFFPLFLQKTTQACDAKGGAIWLVSKAGQAQQPEFQLAAEVEFETSLFQKDEVQRALLLQILAQVVNQRTPVVLSPASAPESGSLEAMLQQGDPTKAGQRNRTPHPFLQVPLLMKEQVVGVLQVWLQPYVSPQNYPEFVTFLSSLGTYVEQHLQSRRIGSLIVENQRLQHLLKFASDLAGSLDPQEVARLASHYGRDLIGCERCSIAWIREGVWEILSISGQETVEKKSTTVKALLDFVRTHTGSSLVALAKKDLLPAPAAAADTAGTAAPEQETVDGSYFELSHMLSCTVVPFLSGEGEILGALFAESSSEGLFVAAAAAGEAGPREHSTSCRIAEWIAVQTGRSLEAASEYQSLPFLAPGRQLRAARRQLAGSRRRKTLIRLWSAGAVLGLLALYPSMEQVDANCNLLPVQRAVVVPEIPGRLERILVKEGDPVEKDAAIAQLDSRRIETDLAANAQERQRFQAESERYRSLGDEANAQVALLQARVADQTEKKLRADLESATLRSPIRGVVLSKDLDLRAGEFLQTGAPFAELADLSRWELVVEVDEKKIGRVEMALSRNPGGLPVRYLLYSHSADTLAARLRQPSQISSFAQPRENQSVFLLSIRDVEIPARLLPAMRPGLTGRAKVQLGRKPLAYLTACRVWDWLRLRLLS